MANDKYKQSLSLCAFGQSRPPNVNDDASKGFSLGSIWSYEGRIYKLKNPSNGAAEWFNSSQRFQQFPVYTVATEEVDLGVQTIQGVTQITSLFTAQADPADNGFYSWGGSSWSKPTFPFGVWLEEYDMMSGCLFTALDGTETRKGYVLNTGAVNFKFLQIGASNVPTELSSYFFSSVNSDVSGYESMPDLQSYVAGSEANNGGVSVSTTPTLLGSFITDSGHPNVTKIPIGIFSAHVEVEKTAGSNNYSTFFELYKRNLAGTETLLVTSDSSSEVASNTRQQISVTAYISNPITLLTTDRIVIKWYSVMLSSTATITMYYDGTTNARLSIPAITTGNTITDLSGIPTSTATANTLAFFDADKELVSATDILLGTLGIAKTQEFDLAFNGSATAFTKTHNLNNTKAIHYTIQMPDGTLVQQNEDGILEYTVTKTTTTITVTFAVAPSSGTGYLTVTGIQKEAPAPSEGIFDETFDTTFE